jgi:hypothetical protein
VLGGYVAHRSFLSGAVTYYELRSTENADKARVGGEKLDVVTAEAG